MPHNRRRRFSVQNNICGNGRRDSGKCDSNLQIGSHQKCTAEPKYSSTIIQTSESIDKTTEQEKELASSLITRLEPSSSTNDKNVSANSSTIKLYNILTNIPDPGSELGVAETQNKTHRSRERKSSRSAKRDKHIHCAHVRSPKRKALALPSRSNSSNRSIGTSPMTRKPFIILTKDDKTEIPETNSSIGESSAQSPSMNRRSSSSMDDMCRICHGGEGVSQELGQLISACMCRGTVGRVHVKCLERWLTESGKSKCELCGTRYMTRRVHRYGVPRGLVMWVLSHNAKQLLVDSLGIMLMSPLAVLAAWLSGRTLAGLMTQDAYVTPWPLASTFVLACMTLVCYYCWIVSAATRHALGWWVWYRSQYEVRLTILDSDDSFS